MDGSHDSGRKHSLPIAGTGVSSAARVLDDWYVACLSSELEDEPLATRLYDMPIVVFRTRDGVAALLDRCPHRNVALSDGTVEGDVLRCGYHGWTFEADGRCAEIPTRCITDEAEAKTRGRNATAFAAREQDGVVWVYATPDGEPVREPYVFEWARDPRYYTQRESFEVEGTVHAVAENALDVPHTAFLHSGLFRKASTGNEIEVVVRRWHDRAEAQYIGEPRPPGVAGRLLAPQGGVLTHYDRFVLPSITEVEYRLGDSSHIQTVSALTPLSDTRTRLTAVVSLRLPIPAALISPVLGPLARAIFRQDAEVLEKQAQNIERFGGESFVSTEVDALGPQILRLLRNAERGDRAPVDEPHEHRFKMRI